MEQKIINICWGIIIFGGILLFGFISVLLDRYRRRWLEYLADKKDKKLFDRVLFGLLSSKQPKTQRGNPIFNIDVMDGFQFEAFLREMFKTLGYKVKKTPDSGDFGADLYMEKDGKKYVVQAKRYKDTVGLSAVQEVVAAKAYYKADTGIVITNNHLTKGAKTLAKTNNVIVYERPDLIKLVQESRMIVEKQKQNSIRREVG